MGSHVILCINTAGYIFTKVLRAVVKSWRGKGHKVIVFLDDGIGGAQGKERAVEMSFPSYSLIY